LKTKKQEIGIGELFRRKFENSEVIPDASVNSKLMRALARREFVHFYPAKFNIYYLGALLAAGIAATVFLFSGAGKSNNLTSANFSEVTDTIGRNTIFNIAAGSSVIKETERTLHRAPDSLNYVVMGALKPESGLKNIRDSMSVNNNNIVPSGVRDSFAINGLLPEASADSKQLRGRNRNDGVLFEPSSLTGCVPLKIHFTNMASLCDSCKWTFGDGGYSKQKDPDWIFDVEGDYQVILKVFGPNGIQTTSSATIKVFPKPQALFEISPLKVVLPDDEVRFLNYTANGTKFQWNFGDGGMSELFEPRHKYLKYGKYNVQLIVTSEKGCTDTLIVMNAFESSEYFIEFPNAFIPNPGGPSGGFSSTKSDEGAQVFHPACSGVSEYQVKIFSKLGILIFESKDVNIGWDGYYKGQLSNPGVYIWKARGRFLNGELFVKLGDVTLLKN
jgi:PKD repeat protein